MRQTQCLQLTVIIGQHESGAENCGRVQKYDRLSTPISVGSFPAKRKEVKVEN